MDKDEKFQMYANDLAKNVPSEILRHLMNLFMFEAARNMAAECKDEILETVIYFVNSEFSYLPINFIASSFTRGSLGKYSDKRCSGRLNPRTIYGWLTEAVIEYNLAMAHKRQEELDAIPFQAVDLRKYPLGRAICWKIDYVTEENWDKVPLKEVARMIGERYQPTLKHFGIKSE